MQRLAALVPCKLDEEPHVMCDKSLERPDFHREEIRRGEPLPNGLWSRRGIKPVRFRMFATVARATR